MLRNQLKKFESLRYNQRGTWWLCECPKCGKKHLEVNTQTGVYHCFYATCDFHGKLTADHRPRQTDTHHSVGNDSERLGVRLQYTDFRPSDLVSVGEEHMRQEVPLSVNPDTQDPIQQQVRKYLQACGIRVETAAEMGVMCSYTSSGFVSLDYVNWWDGRPVNIKRRTISQTGKTGNVDSLGFDKEFMQISPNKEHMPPYGIESLQNVDDDNTLIITEGEKDCLILRSLGFPCVVSLPNGAGTDIAKCFRPFTELLARIAKVIICGDTDHSGRTAQQHLVDYFGVKAWRVSWPEEWHCKDIGEVMLQKGPDAVYIAFENATRTGGSALVTPAEERKGIKDYLRGHYDHGYDLGYGPLTDAHFHPTNEGGLIIVTGKPNSGKTDFLNDLTCRLMMKRNKYVAFLSFEVPDKRKHMGRMVRLMMGHSDLSCCPGEILDAAIDRLENHMVHISMGSVLPTPENIIQQADLIRLHHPLSYLVIDPFLFVVLENGRQTTETQAITRTLSSIQAWGREHKVWVIVVAHPRKLGKKQDGSNDFEDIDFYSINGSAAWANLADFLFSLERCFPKELNGKSLGRSVRSYTRMVMLKVRDQEYCVTGDVFYLRQGCGRYDERDSPEFCISELLGNCHGSMDREEWGR